MSSVAISGNASGAGVFTVAAPNSASSFTLTLPVQTGTLVSGANANSVTLPGATSGTLTLTAPAVAGTNTLTLLAATATSSVNVLGTAVASTSGTSIDFTALPAWVKKITVMFSGVSTNGTSIPLIQLGTGSTTYTTSGYLGSVATNSTIINPTTGIGLSGVGFAAYTRSGIITFTNISANTWVGSGVLGDSSGANINYMGATISLAAALTAVRITTTNGTDTYDAGTINILYEG